MLPGAGRNWGCSVSWLYRSCHIDRSQSRIGRGRDCRDTSSSRAVYGAPKPADHVTEQGIPAVEFPKGSTAPVLSPLAVAVVADVLIAGWMLVVIDAPVRAFRDDSPCRGRARISCTSGGRLVPTPGCYRSTPDPQSLAPVGLWSPGTGASSRSKTFPPPACPRG